MVPCGDSLPENAATQRKIEARGKGAKRKVEGEI